MDFSFSEAQLEHAEHVRRFVSEDLPRLLPEQPDDATFARAAWERCAEQGLLRWRVPQALGGASLDLTTLALAFETFGRYCPDLGFSYAFSANSWSLQTALIEFCSPEQRHYLEDVMAGRRIGAFAMTEGSAGSDTAALETRATRDGDDYVLNGSKAYVTLGPVADFAVVFASTNPEARAWGVSAFLVDRGTPGFEQLPADPKMGLAGTPIGCFELRECRIPVANRLGAEGVGSSLFSRVMEKERPFILAFTVGAMARQLDEAISFAQTREQFGQPIGKLQSVANRIVDMRLRLEFARMLVYKTAWLQSQGNSAQLEGAMAKLYLAEAFTASSLDALKTQGGRGYLTESGAGSDLAAAIGGLLYGGTTDIQRVVIARCLGL
ncbi:MAG: acyl-CoA dehydrogenase family protein [Pseudomonadota bacterium]